MSELQIRRSHQLADAKLGEIAQAIGDKLTSRHGGSCQTAAQQMRYEKPGTATALVEWTSSEIVVTVTLGAMAALLKPLIGGEIERQLDKYLTV